MKKKISLLAVLATGGTIAGSGTAGKATNYTAGQLDVGTLVDSAAGVTDIANVRGIQVCNVGSDDITDENWITLANTINELAQDENIDGFVKIVTTCKENDNGVVTFKSALTRVLDDAYGDCDFDFVCCGVKNGVGCYVVSIYDYVW